MKKKYLIVVADYYKNIADGLITSALKIIPKKNLIKIIKVPGVFEIFFNALFNNSSAIFL